jgi:radical SAM enzyme (TIGR01210 family)
MVSTYPARNRSAWILAQRPTGGCLPDPWAPHGIFLEKERLDSGAVVDSGVVLLTNKECPWRCLMCDLWKGTTNEKVPSGAIPRQVSVACRDWEAKGVAPSQVKLYNSGSFFDPAAIPREDYAGIAAELGFASNVVVESHPKLIGAQAARLRDLLTGGLEVAIGLETAHEEVLGLLNKGFDLAQFALASARLRGEDISMRAFLLVNPPFMPPGEALDWVVKSADFAFSCGASAVSLIPTRAGNGAMERLLESGEFVLPNLADLEVAQSRAIALGKGRVFADIWDLKQFSRCEHCFEKRVERLQCVNLTQQDLPLISCRSCGGT